MVMIAELFCTDHYRAVRHVRRLSEPAGMAGSAGGDLTAQALPRADMSGVSDLEIEILIEIVARAGAVEGVEAELDLVDIDYDNLFALPESALPVLADLADMPAEDLRAIAQAWAEADEMASSIEVTEPLVRAVGRLAKEAIGRGEELFFWQSL